jgi:hypothetical protein
MPDIFDQIAPETSDAGDIFDQIAPSGLHPDTLAQLNRDIRLTEGGRQMGAGNDQLLSAVVDSVVPDPPTPQELRQREIAKAAGVETIPLGLRVASGLDTGIRQGMATPARLVHGAADLALGAVGAGNTAPARWNADMLRQYAQWEAGMNARDVATFGDNDIANQLASGTGRAVTELPLYLAPGMAAANPAQAVARSAAAGGVVGGGTQYAQDRGEGRGRADAATYATASGLITALTTRAFGATGAESVFRNEGVSGLRNRVLQVLKDAGLEGAEEAADQVQQDFLERYSRNPDKPVDATLKEVLMAGAIGGIVGGGVAGTAQGVQAGAGLASDLLTMRNPEQDMMGSPLDTLAGEAARGDARPTGGEQNQNQEVLDAAAAEFNQQRAAETRGDIFDQVASESQSAQSASASNTDGKQQTPGAAVTTDAPAGASPTQAAKVRAELQALPGANQDLVEDGGLKMEDGRKAPALTAEQTDAGLREASPEDAAPVTKGDLKALVNFFQNGGPNPFAAKPQPIQQKETKETENLPSGTPDAQGKPPITLPASAAPVEWTSDEPDGELQRRNKREFLNQLPKAEQAAWGKYFDQWGVDQTLVSRVEFLEDELQNMASGGVDLLGALQTEAVKMPLPEYWQRLERAYQKNFPQTITGSNVQTGTAMPVPPQAGGAIRQGNERQGNEVTTAKVDFIAPETPAAQKIEIKNGDTVSVVTRAGAKPRNARVIQMQPDGSAQVVVAGEKTARMVNANQITPSRRTVTLQAKADELAGFTPEQQTQIKTRAAEFRQLVEDYAPQLEWTPAEAYDESFGADTKDVGFRKAELRTNAIRQAMRAVFPNGQENSQVDQANALPKLEAYLRQQFPGDNSVAKRRTLEEFGRSETPPQETAAVERDQATLDQLAAANPRKSYLQGLRSVGRTGRTGRGQGGLRQRGAGAGVLPSTGASAVTELERIFGVRIIFVDGAEFNGLKVSGSKVILINTKSPRATMAIAGHELLHHIKAVHPGLYADFVAQARALLKNSEQFRAELARKGYSNLTEDVVTEEMFADVLGDAVLDPAFLQQLAKSEPNLFKRFARTAVKWLEKLIAKAKALTGFDSAQYVTDLTEMREQLLNLLREAGRQTQFRNAGIAENEEGGMQNEETFSRQRMQLSNATITAPGLVDMGDRFSLTAHHGTPHKVDKFTTAKIGTGEGAQVYGWGLYFAENPAVADVYKENLSKQYPTKIEYKGKKLSPDERLQRENDYKLITPEEKAAIMVGHFGKDGAIERLKSDRDYIQQASPYDLQVDNPTFDKAASLKWLAESIGAVANINAADIKVEKPGATYTVTLNAEPEDLLDWDKPLSEQSEKVKRAVSSLSVNEGPNASGQLIYSAIANFPSDYDDHKMAAASKQLLTAGIKGIRFLDQGSRGQTDVFESGGKWYVVGDKSSKTAKEFATKKEADDYADSLPNRTYNYVIFSDDDITITHENGQEITARDMFSMEGGDMFGFAAPESVAEQKQRIKNEKLKIQNAKAKEAMQERAGARLIGKDLDTTQEMFGAEVKRDKAGQGDMFSLEKKQFPERFALAKPIKGPTGASIVGYEWRSTMGEKYSAREGGMVDARVSDWDNADESTGTGRAIVHVFYVEHPNGTVHPEGIRSAQTVLGINESRLMTIAKKERAAQQYRQDQERSEMASYDKAAVATAQEAARDYRKVNYSPMRTFEENNDGFNESALFEKNGKFIRRNWKSAERMQRNGWTLVKDDPARTGGTAKAIDAVRETEPESQSSGGFPQEITDAVRDWRGAEKRYRRAKRQDPGDVEDAQDAREEAEINFRMLAQKHNITQAQFDELTESAKATDTEQMGDMFSREKGQSEFTKLQADITAAEAELMDAIRNHMTPPEGVRKAEALQAKNAAAAKLNRLLVQQLKLMTSANVDAARSPEQTAEMISQTVDLLNQLSDEISTFNARSQEVPADLTKLRQDLQTRLNLLKGWTDDQIDKEAQGRVERDKPESLESRMRYMEIEGATNPSKLSFPYWYERFKLGLKKFTSPIPELPMFGDRARFTALFKRGYRLFSVENNRVKKEAAEKVQKVLDPLAKLGRKPADNDALQRYYRLSERFANARKAGDETRIKELAQQLYDLEQTTLNKDPMNLFRRMVLYRDFYWRGTYLKNENGKPITLPGGLTADEVLVQLRKLTKAISEHPDGLAITEALRRHYALMEELRQSILDHGEIIPEALNNPCYWPHLLSEYYSDNLGRVNPTTEESFRKYLITPVGSDRLIQTDYIKAVLQHTAEVLSHNARADMVEKYWAAYDVSEQLKEQHGDKWDHAYNLPPGYSLYAPYKKLPLRATYILPRDVLANQLGVLLNAGDLRTKMVGKVVKVKPEDLRTAMVAGEKIKWALPTEIVDALHGIEKREAALMNQPGHIGAAAGKYVRMGQNIWKKLKLFGPTSFARYTFGNLTTDAIDKVLAGDPKIAAQMRRAARELWSADDGDLSPEYKAAAREGVFETVTAAEVGELEKIPEFKEFLTTGQIRKVAADKVLGAPAALNSFREAVFRYAKFLADVERLRAGEELPFTGMYHKDIDALGAMPNGKKPVLEGDELIYARAGENSLKHFGDYAMLAVNTQWLRRYLMPFVSWTDVNLRYHATLAANMIDAFKPGASDTQRVHALRVSGAKIALTLGLIGLGKELWNQVGGPLLGLWRDDDDLENKLSPADRRRGHVILGKDANGQVMVVYTPSAWGDVAEWVGGQNFKRLFLEFARGEITMDQWLVDYTKQVFPDFANKLIQSAGPVVKGPYELVSGKAVFPDFFDQRTIAKSEQWWRFVGTMTDDRMANWVRGVFDEDYYNQPMAEQLQQIVLQVRRRDPLAWAFYEIKDKVGDWEFEKTGKRNSMGDYTAPEAMALRNFRKAIYRGDVVAADRFYNSLLRYGYTAKRLDQSIRNQAPLAALNEQQREQFLSELSARDRKQLELAEAYYARFSAMDGREKDLFPEEGDEPAPDPSLLREIIESQRNSQ